MEIVKRGGKSCQECTRRRKNNRNYQIKKAPKAAIEEADSSDKRNRTIEEADSADKRNRGSQEVNEQIE